MHQLWAAAIGDYGKWLVAAKRPSSTIKLRLYQLRRFAVREPWEQTEQGWSTSCPSRSGRPRPGSRTGRRYAFLRMGAFSRVCRA